MQSRLPYLTAARHVLNPYSFCPRLCPTTNFTFNFTVHFQFFILDIMKLYEPLPVRLLTHNIRYATDSPFKGEEKWDVRKSRLINELSFNTAHCAESFICLQEVLHKQLVDILSGLNSKKKAWAFVGVGRDDGLEAGEYSPICTYSRSPCFLSWTRFLVLKHVSGTCYSRNMFYRSIYPLKQAILTAKL